MKSILITILIVLSFSINVIAQDECRDLYREKVEELLVQGKIFDVIESLNSVANMYTDQNKYIEAESIYKWALQISEKSINQYPSFMALSLNNLALLYCDQGRYEEAEPMYKRSLEIRERILGSEHPDVALSLNNLAELYRIQGRYVEAEPLFNRVLINLSNQFERLFMYSSEKSKQDFLKTVNGYFYNYYLFAYEYSKTNPSIITKLYNLLLWHKGIILTSQSAMVRSILESGDSTAIETLNRLKSKREQLAYLYSNPIDNVELYKQQLQILEQESDELEKELSRISSAYRAEKELQTVQWKNIRDHLHSDEAAIEFIAFPKSPDSMLYCALIITPQIQDHPLLVTLGTESDLKWLIDTEYKLQINQRTDKDFKSASHTYDFIWKPLESYLSNSKRVFVSPDGLLNQIALGILVNPQGRFLNDVHELRYVSSTKDILKTDPSAEMNRYWILFGDPRFSADTNAIRQSRHGGDIELAADTRSIYSHDLKRSPLGDLPGTQREIESIHYLLSSNRIPVQVYTGLQAIEENMKAVKSAKVLHVATHGFFMPEQKIDYSKFMAGLNHDQLQSVYIENPLLRSGLYFSGANNDISSSDMDDGVFTAYEAANLDLRGTELVVLSACETGLGEIQAGEGVFGLRRAFQFAGAEAVMMSLWSVPDQETQELMTLFYQNWLKTKDKYSSFRNAQQEIRQIVLKRYGRDIPFYWGAFVMVGK